MSASRRSRRHTRSLQRSSTTASEAAILAPSEATIRFAESEQDMVAIHQFLLAVAGPAMLCQVDPIKSLEEIMRVVAHEAALMLIKDGRLVGTMGIISPVWWYGNEKFMT